VIDPNAHGIAPHQPSIVGLQQIRDLNHVVHARRLRRCRVRLRALYLALGLKPILQIVTVSPSALLDRDQDGRLVRLRGECGLGSGLTHVLAGSFLFLDLVGMAIYPFFQLFSLPL